MLGWLGDDIGDAGNRLRACVVMDIAVQGKPMSRTGQQRLDAIEPAINRRDDFRRVVDAVGADVGRLADLMAEAITMRIEASGLETVGKNGKVTVSVEAVCASHCMIYVRDAYLKAKS